MESFFSLGCCKDDLNLNSEYSQNIDPVSAGTVGKKIMQVFGARWYFIFINMWDKGCHPENDVVVLPAGDHESLILDVLHLAESSLIF